MNRRLNNQQKRRISANKKAISKDLNTNLKQGKVVSHNGYLLLIKNNNNQIIKCHFRQNLHEIATGDNVIYSTEKNSKTGIVHSVINRKNLLKRSNKITHKIKAIAANIDQIYIVIAVEPEPVEYYIDCYIVAAELMGIKPIIIFNKTDCLTKENSEKIEEVIQLYLKLNYEVIKTSTLTMISSELVQSMKNKCSIFIGQSGVGKSALINQLTGDKVASTGNISDFTHKGKHTTTKSQLYETAHGISIIDSPGIREFELWNITEQELLKGFIEIQEQVFNCQFRNCKHSTEEIGCSVREAYLKGKIDKRRLNNYFRIRAELITSNT